MGEYSSGKFSSGEFTAGELDEGKLSAGEFDEREFSVGEFSGHQLKLSSFLKSSFFLALECCLQFRENLLHGVLLRDLFVTK